MSNLHLIAAALALGLVGAVVLCIRAWRDARALRTRYAPLVSLDEELRRLEEERDRTVRQLEQQRDALTKEIEHKKKTFDGQYAAALKDLEALSKHVALFSEQAELQSFGLYKPYYDLTDSDQYRHALDAIREQQAAMLKAKKAAFCPVEWQVEGSRAKGNQMTERYLKLQLRAFNGECDAAVAKVRFNNAVAMQERIRKAFETINKLGETQRCQIDPKYLDLKLAELRLAHEHEEKLHAEKEEQRRIKEQMREEEQARRELERAQKEAEKEEGRYETALEKARAELTDASQREKDALAGKIAELEKRLTEAHAAKERAISQAQLTRSGHVYVISNEGSFGPHVFKVGMTRRLDPLDRVKELGDASVPFAFDVHAIIYSEDAPDLETKLHRRLAEQRVNLVNDKKEFLRIPGQADHPFRRKPITDSGPSRSLNGRPAVGPS